MPGIPRVVTKLQEDSAAMPGQDLTFWYIYIYSEGTQPVYSVWRQVEPGGLTFHGQICIKKVTRNVTICAHVTTVNKKWIDRRFDFDITGSFIDYGLHRPSP